MITDSDGWIGLKSTPTTSDPGWASAKYDVTSAIRLIAILSAGIPALTVFYSPAPGANSEVQNAFRPHFRRRTESQDPVEGEDPHVVLSLYREGLAECIGCKGVEPMVHIEALGFTVVVWKRRILGVELSATLCNSGKVAGL